MKKKVLAASLMLGFAWLQCLAQKGKKPGYDLPVAMSEDVRAQYARMCDKGQILYEINCGSCHNVKVKGKRLIPDFTQEQIDGYEIRIGNSTHERALTDDAVTTEELGLISTFLLYKKKSGAQVRDAFGGKLSEDRG